MCQKMMQIGRKKSPTPQKHKLWHYHIDIPHYETANNGEQVSEYILHYQKFDDEIRLISINSSQSFKLPSESQLIQKITHIRVILRDTTTNK